MFGNVVLGIDKDRFEHSLSAVKAAKGAKLDIDLTAEDLLEVVAAFKKVIRDVTGQEFPQDARDQLAMSRDAVFRSWNNDRAIYYRKQRSIPDDLGTAVNVQAMVFGNKGANSATGVGFTRNPSTGTREFYGEYLLNAQGEDVVAGIRTPEPIVHLGTELPKVYEELRTHTDRLERHYRDVQDFEFTVEEGKLYMLQTRRGQRTAQAAVKIAVDMVAEGLITKEEALMRVEPEQLEPAAPPPHRPDREDQGSRAGIGGVARRGGRQGRLRSG